jgi:hypothetical protein
MTTTKGTTMKTPAYYMNDSVTMQRELNCVRYGESCSQLSELKFTFVMVDSTEESPIILTIADSENNNYTQAIDDGIQYLNDLHGVDTIGNYSVVHYQYNERSNMSTYYIHLLA